MGHTGVTHIGVDSATLFQGAIDASPSGILVVDRDGKVVLVNRELERQFGYVREDLLGQSIDLLVPEAGALHRAHHEALNRAPLTRATGDGHALFGRRKDGSLIPVEIGLSPLQMADRVHTLASVVDISERRELERLRQEEFEDQRAFQLFVAEMSVRFMNVPSDGIDGAIGDALVHISEVFAVDRCSLHLAAAEQLPWTYSRVLAGEVVSFSNLAEVPDVTDRNTYGALGTRSALMVPLSVGGRAIGAVALESVRAERTWPAAATHRLTVLASVLEQVLARRASEDALRLAIADVERLKERVHVENIRLRREVRQRMGSTPVVGKSAAVCHVLDQIQQVAATGSTVLLLGETGVGKELFATQIHELGPRHSRPMVRVNCAAIPATLIESELFGREKGAFTGSLARQIGRFELASASTIFLDEIGDLPADVQVKLLRVLETGQVERLGSPRPIAVDTRIIVATHRNLEQRMAEGAFRPDLFYRLNVFPIRVPPLRERPEDIPLLVWCFVEEFSKAFGKRIDSIADRSLAALQHYSWPGNIRELRNVVERAMITAAGPRLTINPPAGSAAANRRSAKLVDVEREHIRSVLEDSGWRIRGAAGAADRLGLKPTTLETRMAKLGLRRGARR